MRTITNVSRRGFLRQSFGAGAFVLGARRFHLGSHPVVNAVWLRFVSSVRHR